MTGGLQQFARQLANVSLDQALSAPVVDPVFQAINAKASAYAERLSESLARTDAMLSQCPCGRPSVFCLRDIGQCHLCEGSKQ